MAAADNAQDEILTHAVDLERAKITNVAQVTSFLNTLETDLVKEIAARPVPPAGQATLKDKKLAALLAQTSASIGSTYKSIADTHEQQLTQVARLSGQVGANTLNAGIGAQVTHSVALTANQLSKLASDTLVQGAKSRDWWDKQSSDLEHDFSAQMRLGYARGESVDQLSQRVRGTQAGNFNNGLMSAKKREADALVRSSVQVVSNEAKIQTYEDNADLLDGIEWIATLDRRTTPICRALDGKVWSLPDYKPVGHDFPYPGSTAHWNCRSTQLPKLKSWSDLAGKKIIDPTEGGDPTTLNNAFRENLRAQGLSEDQVAAAVYDARASMDGQSPQSYDFGEWLQAKEKKTPGFAAELLGPKRAELFNAGKVTVSDLIDTNYRTLNLDQLEALVQGRAAAIAGKAVEPPAPVEIVPPPLPTVAEQAVAARAAIAHIGDQQTGLRAEVEAVHAQAKDALAAFESVQKTIYATNRAGDSYEKARETPEYKEFKRLQALRGEKYAALEAAQKAARPAIEQTLQVDPAKRGTVKAQFVVPKTVFGAAIRETATEAIDILQRIMEASRIPSAVLGVERTGKSRAFYSGVRGSVNLTNRGKTTTALHEIGHWIEAKNPDVMKMSADFLARRTQGETARKLSKIYPGQGYGSGEIAKEDKFLHAYMGKIYSTAANGLPSYTEILSMGLEQYWYNPTEFAAKDPDYFDFVYSVLRATDAKL